MSSPTGRVGEPALIIGLVTSVLAALVPLGLPGLSAGQVSLLDAFVAAVGGVVIAIRTRPVGPAAFTTLLSVGAALLAGYGVHFSPALVGAASGIVVAGFAFLTSLRASPKNPDAMV